MNPRHFFIDSPARLRRVLEELGKYQPSAEAPVEISIGPWHKRPRPEQYRAYWALLGDISRQAWVEVEGGRRRRYEPWAWHDYYRLKFLGAHDGPGGVTSPVSTGELSPEAFSNYIRRVEANAVQELKVLITDRRNSDDAGTDGGG